MCTKSFGFKDAFTLAHDAADVSAFFTTPLRVFWKHASFLWRLSAISSSSSLSNSFRSALAKSSITTAIMFLGCPPALLLSLLRIRHVPFLADEDAVSETRAPGNDCRATVIPAESPNVFTVKRVAAFQ
jgi:hypothetical protein